MRIAWLALDSDIPATVSIDLASLATAWQPRSQPMRAIERFSLLFANFLNSTVNQADWIVADLPMERPVTTTRSMGMAIGSLYSSRIFSRIPSSLYLRTRSFCHEIIANQTCMKGFFLQVALSVVISCFFAFRFPLPESLSLFFARRNYMLITPEIDALSS